MAGTLNPKSLPTAPGRHGDGKGLYLNIKPSGAASWVFVYRRGDKRIERGLGSLKSVGLTAARSKTRAARAKLELGLDPFPTAAGPGENQTAWVPTFGAEAVELIESLKPSWRNAKHGQQWVNTLRQHASAIWSMPVDQIDAAAVLAVLRPIWSTIPETAFRLRGRIERVLDAAKVKGLRSGENPARWRGHLEVLLPARNKQAVKHHPAMDYQDVPGFIQDLRRRDSMSARALEFMILTAARTGEVIGATWAEFDLTAALWIIPAERMKAGLEHRVPLTSRVVQILEQQKLLSRPRPFQISNMAMKQCLRRMDLAEFTPHGFRSSFRDWVAEETDFPGDIAEAALAHQVGNSVERAYRRGDALKKRRTLMEAWQAFVCGK